MLVIMHTRNNGQMLIMMRVYTQCVLHHHDTGMQVDEREQNLLSR